MKIIKDMQTLRHLLVSLLICMLSAAAWAQQRYPMYPGYPYYGQPGQQPYYGQPRQQQPYAPPAQQQPYAPPAQQQPYAPPAQQQPYAPPAQQQPYAPPAQQQQSPGPGQQYRPQQSWPQAPARSPYTQSSPQVTGQNPPRLEVLISGQRPYIQQTLVLTLRIISSSNLASVQPEIPSGGPLIFSKLDGPIASAHRSGGQQEIVNEFHYAVTPLQSGMVSIPLVRVKGTLNGGQKSEFDIASPASILLDVQPVDPSVQPWLPLHGLILQSRLEGAEHPEAGKPLTLVVDISAIGATGGQLPSFENHLRESAFHVYREDSDIEGRVSSDGRYLLGHKTETFTLVPQNGGKLRIPELRVSWWNVGTGLAETSSVPIRQLIVKGEPGPDAGQIRDLFPEASSLLLWIPLIGLFGATIGFWILAWLRQKRFVQVAEEEITVVLSFAARRVRTFLAWLSPIRRLQKVRQIFVRSLPRSFRLYFCVHVVDGEDDPEDWSYMLKFLGNKHLGIPAQLPLQDFGDRLSDIHPHSNRQLMRDLMRELEQTLYSNGSMDFSAWKRRFRNQLKPSWLPQLGRKAASRPSANQRLPRLNPGV